MPDPPNYNTRLRTNSLILPPRRLRHSPSPPPRQRQSKLKTNLPHHNDLPHFPPQHVVLHPEDAANKTFLAIGRAMLAIDNRAITIKDLSQLSLDYGLLCQNASAASQAITTFIRNHLARCHQDRSKPLLLSLPLTGTPADDCLAPALHSRTGGTSSLKEPDSSLTSFRRGTTVWYLSESAGAPCPFRRAGLCIEEITRAASKGTKRKRDSHHTLPRKHSTPGPAMATRTRAHAEASNATTSRLRLKLTFKPRDPPPPSESYAESGSASSESELSELESESDRDALPNASRPPSASPDSSATDDSTSISDLASSFHSDDPIPVRSQDLPPYPILSPSIPSPSCTTPGTSLASPSVAFSDPFLPHNAGSPLCSPPLIKSTFSSFRTALSNLPRDHRARSRSLPFSAASPPPDSEDEDEDYHNSMIGLRRGSMSPSMKQEEEEETESASKYEPIAPKYVSGSVHLAMKDWQTYGASPMKQEDSAEGVSTPLELLPGFVSLSPESESAGVPVKDEPTSAVLPPAESNDLRWSNVSVKPEQVSDDEQTVLDPEDIQRHVASMGKGTREDPVRIEAVMGDVEVLGPESVRSREWDAAWGSAANAEARREEKDEMADAMDVDGMVQTVRVCTPLSDRDVFEHRRDEDLRASPAETLVTAPTSISSPPSEEMLLLDGEHDAPFVIHPLRPCDPPIIATVIEGVPVYHTLLAPGLPLLRRIDTSLVNLTPLMIFLGLPLSALLSYTDATPRMSISRAPEPLGGTWVPLSVAQGVARHACAGKVPASVRDMFLSPELGMWFPDALVRLVQLHDKGVSTGEAAAPALLLKEVGIRVEDVFVSAECAEVKQDARFRPDAPDPLLPLMSRTSMAIPKSSLLFESSRPTYASIPLSVPLNEQEERLFHSFVDFFGTGVPPKPSSTSSSPLSSPPDSPPIKPAIATVTISTSSAKDKENATKAKLENAPPVRRKRDKTVEMPVRRSKRALAAKLSAAPVTRSRSRGNCSEGKVLG